MYQIALFRKKFFSIKIISQNFSLFGNPIKKIASEINTLKQLLSVITFLLIIYKFKK